MKKESTRKKKSHINLHGDALMLHNSFRSLVPLHSFALRSYYSYCSCHSYQPYCSCCSYHSYTVGGMFGYASPYCSSEGKNKMLSGMLEIYFVFGFEYFMHFLHLRVLFQLHLLFNWDKFINILFSRYILLKKC